MSWGYGLVQQGKDRDKRAERCECDGCFVLLLRPLQHGACLDQEEIKMDIAGGGFCDFVVVLEGWVIS